MRDRHRSPMFSDSFRASGMDIEVRADHSRRRRPTKPHEHARQIMRGQPPSPMSEEETFNWRILANRRCMGVIRENPNGSFSCGHATAHVPHDPALALRRVACAVLRIDPNTIEGSGGKAKA